jgi:uncharacterized protein YndB with AHSA1/START domain
MPEVNAALQERNDGSPKSFAGPAEIWVESLDALASEDAAVRTCCRTSERHRSTGYTALDSLCQWFGPDGYTCTVHEMDARPGGRARLDMTAPDGPVHTGRFDYLDVVPGERLVFDHGSDVDDDPGRFRMTITFDEQADAKTVLTLRQLHPTAEQRTAVIGFGAVELGLQTLTKLARHLGVG